MCTIFVVRVHKHKLLTFVRAHKIRSIYTVLKEMQACEDPKCRDTSRGLLVQLKLIDIHEELPTEQQQRQQQQPTREISSDPVEEHPREPPPSYQETIDAPHVMISYNWDHQDRALKMRGMLKENGYNIWMDVDKMGR